MVGVLLCCAISTCAAFGEPSDGVRDLPDRHLTPGVVATRDTATVCQAGYARAIRPKGTQWRRLKDEVYNAYGLPRGHRSTVDAAGRRHPAYEIDHLVPLELGGSPDAVANLWPQPIAAAERKDRVENELHARVCAGSLTMGDAQKAIVNDWKTAIPVARP